MKYILYSCIVLLIFTFAGCGLFSSTGSGQETTKLTVSAASSMMDSLMALKEQFEAEHPSIEIIYNFGGSGSLRRQIEQGAPIGFFFSASKRHYEALQAQGHIQKGTAIFENKLVAARHAESADISWEEFLQSDGKLALGTPGAVPGGTYAREAMQNMSDWATLEGRIVFAKDASHVLTLVREGAVTAGIVYASDLHGTKQIAVLQEIDPSHHTPIEYFAAVIDRGDGQTEKQRQAALKFYHFVQQESSMELFQQFGFGIDEKLVNE
ncbi:molybdate ABC transporter substrate-binding protein [Lentibacillus sediminis]|uniref:molybdate ABC transporter substrate-binding protein n=1 Tax=Lentibacillus sediminis TaxID=1940529 RepID=UPI000C1C3286|nr:molybdate ABC transporter substrate-binding protein [Lentibacillus sediminis]